MAKEKSQKSFWKFVDDSGTFLTTNPQNISSLYFPLVNEAGMMSSITPELKGDCKTSNDTFLLKPTTRPDLLDSASTRNFWLYNNKTKQTWSIAERTKTKSVLRAGLLYHTLEKTNRRFGVKAQITNFVPSSKEKVELMIINITNITKSNLTLTPTSAIPLYNRSADNIRDHRHVTSLLNRITQNHFGVVVKPQMRFDESGHSINKAIYYVLGIDNNNRAPLGTFPTYDSFLDEGNNFSSPTAVLDNIPPSKLTSYQLNGREAMAAIRFKTIKLHPGQSYEFILTLGIADSQNQMLATFRKFNTITKVHQAFKTTQEFWKKRNNALTFATGNSDYDNWLRWVNLQPTLRKIFGCSFLPDFDYGRGGKGWRDLWQDCLALLLTEPKPLRSLLISNFSGVRIDGTNATIITNKPGKFISDRNKVSRVWMDHGIWPYFTLELYINQTGDANILFEKASYFRDSQILRSKQLDLGWDGIQKLKTKQNKTYNGSLLEHILIQHLTAFFNVGPHNNIRLENADWNDGLDMAAQFGESVAFSSFYAHNLSCLAQLLERIKQAKHIKSIALLKELLILLDTISKSTNYDSVKQKQSLLKKYLQATKLNVSGKVVNIDIDKLIDDLTKKATWLTQHIRKNEWLKCGFFNGYYDNKSKRVEGKTKNKVRMTLTGQVFPIISNTATKKQIKQIINSANKYLKDKKYGGFRLNTNFDQPQFDLGRAFSFAYGEKENGAVFSHMCVMFAYALHSKGFAKEGFQVLNSLYQMATTTKNSKIYPNLPEYFNIDGRGMYSYLTGSASWFIFTLLTQVFGIRGNLGDLVIAPRLTNDLFKKSKTLGVKFSFAGKEISIQFINPKKLGFPSYKIKSIQPKIPLEIISPYEILIKRRSLSALTEKRIQIKVKLG